MKQKVIVGKCKGYDASLVKEAILQMAGYIGPLNAIIRPQREVILKPNMICAAEADRHVTTHPVFIEGVIQIVKDLGGRPVISDSPAFGSLVGVAKKCGLFDIARRYNVPLREFKQPVRLDLITSITPRGLVLDRAAIDAECLINLPKLKSHVQLIYSGAVKNLYGCMPGKRKVWPHFVAQNDTKRFCEMLVRICAVLKPPLTIMDGIIAMQGRGPRKGSTAELGVIVLGKDDVAIDTVISGMLRIKEDRYDILSMARGLGVGTGRQEDIETIGIDVDISNGLKLELPQELDDITFNLPRVIRSAVRHFFIKRICEHIMPRSHAARKPGINDCKE
ncbi:MAG: DUF362 domain-containing protein [Candidatus Omnitrophica bacterium]|nr:DUF362 domain-containing protein [Candidatus Omnitrophota bacterium]